jgi:hypothetical protein
MLVGLRFLPRRFPASPLFMFDVVPRLTSGSVSAPPKPWALSLPFTSGLTASVANPVPRSPSGRLSARDFTAAAAHSYRSFAASNPGGMRSSALALRSR